MNRLTVGYDDQIFVAQSRGGISKYFVELITRLPDHGIDPVVLSRGTRNIHLAESGLVSRLPDRGALAERAAWASWRLVGQPRTTMRPTGRLDLVHHTFSNPRYLRSWGGRRVMTVFDMTPELFPQYFPLGNPHFAKRRFCEKSDAIIAISRNTETDLARLYSAEIAAKTHVIPFGVGEEFLARGNRNLDLPDRYLLFVGVRRGYKEFNRALAAWDQIADDDPSLFFVVAGGGSFSTEEESALQATGKRRRVIHVSPTDRDMPELYERAATFVFPSVYEGFGLPTLESLSAGTPTVLADASCSREVGGDAALYFPPGNTEALVARIREALSSEAQSMAAVNGPTRGREFSWDRVAAMTADLYRATAGSTDL